MMIALTLLALLIRIQLGITIFRTCVPNTNFQFNGKICICDARGWWSEHSCYTETRRRTCQPGQIIWGNCSQCLCQENGQLLCTKSSCSEVNKKDSPVFRKDHFEAASPWCTPFKSYYVNCSICVCPASGRTSEATCAVDTSCSLKGLSESSISSGTACIPTVMYLFQCLHCLCSEDGYFVPNECVTTCNKSQQLDTRRCIPGTFYRKGCNVCRCPENSIPTEEICTKNICEKKTKFKSIRNFKNKVSKCTPYQFTKAKCYYCTCKPEGNINENACLELDCLITSDIKYDIERLTCSPGEMVPVCMECFCPHYGLTDKNYCTKVCSVQTKLLVLGKILKDSISDTRLINREIIKKSSADVNCEPNSLYLDQGRYCLCRENGNRNFNICTSITGELKTLKAHMPLLKNTITMDFNISCEPSTFVDFDCNTCYCGKNGRIDPKWCTYDDCRSKKIIQNNHKLHRALAEITTSSDTCNPGSISKDECNFCICAENGRFKDRACTKNDCSELQDTVYDEKFICEPLAYYIVDCNVCFCPKDGLKNVAKCTKNQCEKNFLRSESCVPGDLFSEDCKVCVCPPNGDKNDKVCTNYSCTFGNSSWQRIFKLSENLLNDRITDESKRNLHVCFPGEEFVDGCKACVCPDMGLREYANCIPMFCDEGTPGSDGEYQTSPNTSISDAETQNLTIKARREGDSCMTYNLTDSSERKECTPGSVYIIRCKQCICPYMGNINNFCRPLPPDVYCEQAFPNFNYLPMGRRSDKDNQTSALPNQITVSHNHTKYSCTNPGRVVDNCFICDCKDHVIIEEHCFKSDSINCTHAVPNFFANKIVNVK